MKKKDLKQMVFNLTASSKAERESHVAETEKLKDTIRKLRKKCEEIHSQNLDKEKQRQEQTQALFMQAVKKHTEVLQAFSTGGTAVKIPAIDEHADENDISNLKYMDDATITVLIRHHFNNELASAYTARRMNMQAFRALVSYFDLYMEAMPLSMTDTMKAEVLKEQLHRDGEKYDMLNKPEPVEFRLRGRKELETFFNKQVVDIVNHSEIYASLGVGFPKGFILEGPPGCGKTYAVERLAEHLGWYVVRINQHSIGNSYVHECAKAIEERFAEAAQNAPSLLIIDEMDAFMPNRSRLNPENTHSKEEVDSFLQCLQTATEKHILVVGMTNLFSSLDPAVTRTGRLGTHIKVDMPSLAEVKDVLAYALEKRPCKKFPLLQYAKLMLNHPLSDVTHVVDEAAINAGHARRGKITERDLSKAIEGLLKKQGAQQPPREPIGFAH